MDYATLSKAVDEILRYKDPHRNYHGREVADLGMKIVDASDNYKIIGVEREMIYWGLCLHDVGKIFIPDYLLNVSRALTRAEFEMMKAHVSMGKIYAEKLELHDIVKDIIIYHHENMDGSGYLAGKISTNIPWYCRLARVLDAYNAMTSRRSYKSPMSSQEVILEMDKTGIRYFDQTFMHLLKKVCNYATAE